MVWLPDGEKRFEDTFIRFDRMHERDRQTHTGTHTQRETPHDDIGRACIASRRKKCTSRSGMTCRRQRSTNL